jgi:DNA-binding transcriptional ArsR family regulator
MPDLRLSISEINRLIHEPARLAILTVLAHCESADFLFLENATGLTRGNLSVQLSKLEEAELVSILKAFHKKKSLTTASITTRGKAELSQYWKTMEHFHLNSASAFSAKE